MKLLLLAIEEIKRDGPGIMLPRSGLAIQLTQASSFIMKGKTTTRMLSPK